MIKDGDTVVLFDNSSNYRSVKVKANKYLYLSLKL